ncbi:unnamed protein product [Brassica oleracea var. botrytis]
MVSLRLALEYQTKGMQCKRKTVLGQEPKTSELQRYINYNYISTPLGLCLYDRESFWVCLRSLHQGPKIDVPVTLLNLMIGKAPTFYWWP